MTKVRTLEELSKIVECQSEILEVSRKFKSLCLSTSESTIKIQDDIKEIQGRVNLHSEHIKVLTKSIESILRLMSEEQECLK